MTYAKPALWLHTLERALGLDDGAADPLDVLRSLEVQAPEARRFVPGCQRSERPGSDAVLRSGVPRLGGVRLRRRQRHEHRDRRRDVRRTRSSCGAMATGSFRSRFSRRSPTASSGASPGTAPAGGTASRSSTRAACVSAQVDPDQILVLDTNFTNNSFTTEPAERARRDEMGGDMAGVAAGSAAHLGLLSSDDDRSRGQRAKGRNPSAATRCGTAFAASIGRPSFSRASSSSRCWPRCPSR